MNRTRVCRAKWVTSSRRAGESRADDVLEGGPLAVEELGSPPNAVSCVSIHYALVQVYCVSFHGFVCEFVDDDVTGSPQTPRKCRS